MDILRDGNSNRGDPAWMRSGALAEASAGASCLEKGASIADRARRARGRCLHLRDLHHRRDSIERILARGTFGYTLGALCTAAMIGAIFIRPSSIAARVLSWRPLVGLGRISYGVYLFHAPIAWAVLHWMPLLRAGWALSTGVAFAGASGAIPIGSAIDPDTFRFLVAAAIVSAITSAVAALHYRYVERWFLSLRTPREE